MVQIMCILAVVMSITFAVPNMTKRLAYINCRRFLWIMFGVYVIGNLYCTVFSREWGSGVTVEFRPFMSIVRLFDEPIEGGGKVVGLFAWFMKGTPPFAGIILNILLFYPLGYMMPFLFTKLKPKKIIYIGCMCSVITEAAQYLLAIGWCETDDVIYNTLGTTLGMAMSCRQRMRSARQ